MGHLLMMDWRTIVASVTLPSVASYALQIAVLCVKTSLVVYLAYIYLAEDE